VDINLPDKSGLLVIDEIKKHSEDLPIIVVSGSDDVQVAVEALKRGAWDYITKPINNFEVFDNTFRKVQEKIGFVTKEREYLSRLKRHSLAAMKMQERLFPDKRMEFGDYIFEHQLIPAIDSSGDFIDYFQIDEKFMGFYLADVAGHGIAAAFLTVILKSFFNLYLKKYYEMQDTTILNPGKMMTFLNNELIDENYERHITLFYGVINRDENKLSYSNAGTYPFPILNDGRENNYVEKNGFPLGFIKDTIYKTGVLKFPEKFLLLLISDGILELFSDENQEAHKNHLLTIIEGYDTNIADIRQEILRLLELQGDKKVPDDISYLLINKRA
jgi:phosphoserine phosphatase RsbU/P